MIGNHSPRRLAQDRDAKTRANAAVLAYELAEAARKRFLEASAALAGKRAK